MYVVVVVVVVVEVVALLLFIAAEAVSDEVDWTAALAFVSPSTLLVMESFLAAPEWRRTTIVVLVEDEEDSVLWR